MLQLTNKLEEIRMQLMRLKICWDMDLRRICHRSRKMAYRKWGRREIINRKDMLLCLVNLKSRMFSLRRLELFLVGELRKRLCLVAHFNLRI